MMRLAVASQKILQAQDIGRLRIANQHRPAATGFDMGDAAQNQRADNPFAELGFGDNERVKPIGRDQQRFDIIIIRFGIDQRDASRELSDLAGELTWSVPHDSRRAAEAIARSHRQRAFQHHEHAGRPLSRREQPLTAAVLPTFAEPFDARDVSLAEYGKGLIAAPPDDALVWVHLDLPVVMHAPNARLGAPPSREAGQDSIRTVKPSAPERWRRESRG